MIQKVEMYQAVCDGCGRREEQMFEKKPKALHVALRKDWMLMDGKLYCPYCGGFMEGFTVNNVTGEYGYRDEYGMFHPLSIVKPNQENMEEKKLNLKPFDLEAAKAGKPVCTRDGRKARIICFDKKGAIYPIVTLVEECGEEHEYSYDTKGKSTVHPKMDLMMLPEKHEGWINIYKDGENSRETERAIFETEEIAKINKCNDGSYITSIKIEWEE